MEQLGKKSICVRLVLLRLHEKNEKKNRGKKYPLVQLSP